MTPSRVDDRTKQSSMMNCKKPVPGAAKREAGAPAAAPMNGTVRLPAQVKAKAKAKRRAPMNESVRSSAQVKTQRGAATTQVPMMLEVAMDSSGQLFQFSMRKEQLESLLHSTRSKSVVKHRKPPPVKRHKSTASSSPGSAASSPTAASSSPGTAASSSPASSSPGTAASSQTASSARPSRTRRPPQERYSPSDGECEDDYRADQYDPL